MLRRVDAALFFWGPFSQTLKDENKKTQFCSHCSFVLFYTTFTVASLNIYNHVQKLKTASGWFSRLSQVWLMLHHLPCSPSLGSLQLFWKKDGLCVIAQLFTSPHWNQKMSGVRRACLSFVAPHWVCRHGKIQTEKFLASPTARCLCTAGVVIAVCWQQFSGWFFGYWEIWLMLLCCSILLWKSITQSVTQLERGWGVGARAAWTHLAQVNLKPPGWEQTGNTSFILCGAAVI